MGKWLGPVFGNWTGKGSSGQDMAPFVRAELGKLVEFMGFGQLKTHATTRELADGTVIQMFGNLNGPEPILAVRVLTTSVEVPLLVLEPYMETGVNDPINVGAENPLRLLPANWQIPTWSVLTPTPYSGIYQGLFNETETVYESNNVSKAVGEDEPSAAVYAKKLLMGLFPPSVFSGMQRLYMQAYYGADNELTNQFRFEVTAFGEVLLYAGEVQLGFWSHLSGGIVRVGADNDLDFRYVTISSPTGGGEYIVREYPIAWDTGTNQIKETYRTASTADKEKALAYLFAHSRIRGDLPTVVGTFTLINEGSDLAYGWKFNNAGTKASICLTELFVDGSSKWHFDSSEITVNFGYSTDGDGNREVTLGTVEETTKVRWHDVVNVQIWRPNTDGVTCHRAYRTLPPQKPAAYDYTDAPIYCWYDDEDVLQVIKVSHTIAAAAASTVYTWSGNIVIDPAKYPINDISKLLESDALQDEYRWMQRLIISSTKTDKVSVGSTSYDMVARYGNLYRVDAHGAQACGASASTFGMRPTFNVYAAYQDAPDYAQLSADIASCGTTGAQYQLRSGYDSYTEQSGNHWQWELVDVYVPALDAEAAYVATLDYLKPEVTATGTLRWWPTAIVGQDYQLYKSGSLCASQTCARVWESARPGWGASNSDPADPVAYSGEIAMNVHSRTLAGSAGAYDGSVDQYFFRGLDAEDPPSKTFRESWGVAAVRGSDLGTLDDDFVALDGTWTGWI